tara:strand:- start:142 stop:477 length:336 start_codon:yes stop_codon:yes gene_type:complete
MTPWQKAKAWFLHHNPGHSFEEKLGEYLAEGEVHSGEDVFVMAKPTLWEDGTMYCGNVAPNTWFVFLSAGNWRRLLAMAPRPMRYVAWQRRGSPRYHVWEFDKLKRKMGGL